MHKRSTVVLCLAGLAAAMAMIWPSQGRAEPGDGLKAGDLKIHPRLSLTGLYDTNVFRLTQGETVAQDGIPSAPALYITPGLSVETIDPTAFKFEFDGDLTWEQYFGASGGISEQSGLTGEADIAGTINPQGAISLKLENDFKHVSEPPYYETRREHNWFRNRGGAVFGIHPGDDILEIDLGYHFNLYQYYFSTGLDLDKHTHEADFDLKWNFLPKTAYVLETDFDVIRYETGTRGIQGAGLPNVDSTPLAIKTGFSGLISRRLRAKLIGGWAWGFYETGPTYSGPVADTHLAFQYGKLPLDNEILAFYKRRFSDSSVTNYADEHRVGAEWNHNLFDKRLSLNADVEYVARDFSPLQAEEVTIDGQTFKQVQNFRGEDVFLPDDMHDQLLNVTAGIEGEFAKWGTVGLKYEYWQNFTTDRVDVPQADLTSLRGYQQHLIKLNTTIKY